MSFWSRIANVFWGYGVSREIDEELELHIKEAIELGRDPEEARRSFGSVLRQREESRDFHLIPWLDSLRADAVFGWRQLLKRKVTSIAAILSLGLAIGACTSAFRLIDALLLRPLPVANPDQLYALARQGVDDSGTVLTADSFAYPAFRLMRAAVKDEAELIAVADAERIDLTFRSDQEMEKASRQYVSGWMFRSFGLRPALGRLLTESDDMKPRGSPVAVLSYDYWTRRFGRDPSVLGRTFRIDDMVYQIVGVVDQPFTGTETGTVTDLFIPTMMHAGVTHDDWTWIRILARLKPGVAVEPLRAKLDATSRAFERERAKSFTGMSQASIDKFLAITMVLEPAAAGASGLQRDYRRSLLALAVLVALVLLIACANVANVLTAQASARSREMALRVSIGAGRWRLMQLVLVESAVLGLLAAATGALFAWWSAPFVVSRINPPDNPVRVSLPADWRVLGFGLALTLVVTLLFGLIPALRASGVKPARALKGGEDVHSRGRVMHALIAVQVAFCFLVLFVAGLFAATFDRLSHQPVGFSADRLLLLDTVAERGQPPVFWDQVAEHLREVPGVEAVAIAGWPLLDGNSWNGFISVNGAPPGPVLAFFMSVSPGWLNAMKIPLRDGRDFRPGDTSPGVAIINEAFANQYFPQENPIGRIFAKGSSRCEVVGVVRNVPYQSIRDPMLPVAYVPFQPLDTHALIRTATFHVRTASPNPLALASTLRREVPRARPEFRVSNLRTQEQLVQAQTVRERLLATLALFFAVVALLLAGVGLYGVLDYSVVQRRREIGIRRAIGAPARDIARRVTANAFGMVILGAIAGFTIGLAAARSLDSLLYEVKPTEPGMLALPCLTIAGAALLAAIPAIVRALRIDPMKMLRAD